jgi:hypothetical protein
MGYFPKGRCWSGEELRAEMLRRLLGRFPHIGEDAAWVSVGIGSDTAEFAVEAIRRWHDSMGCERYANRGELLITADCGGTNGYRVRKYRFANLDGPHASHAKKWGGHLGRPRSSKRDLLAL